MSVCVHETRSLLNLFLYMNGMFYQILKIHSLLAYKYLYILKESQCSSIAAGYC